MSSRSIPSLIIFRVIVSICILFQVVVPVYVYAQDTASKKQDVYLFTQQNKDGNANLMWLAADSEASQVIDTGGKKYDTFRVSEDKSIIFYIKTTAEDKLELWKVSNTGQDAQKVVALPTDDFLLNYVISPTAEHVLLDLVTKKILIEVKTGQQTLINAKGRIVFSHDGKHVLYGYTQGGSSIMWTAAKQSVAAGSKPEVIATQPFSAQYAFIFVWPLHKTDEYVVFAGGLDVRLPDGKRYITWREVFLVSPNGKLSSLFNDQGVYALPVEVLNEDTDPIVVAVADKAGIWLVDVKKGTYSTTGAENISFVTINSIRTKMAYREVPPKDATGDTLKIGLYLADVGEKSGTKLTRDEVVSAIFTGDDRFLNVFSRAKDDKIWKEFHVVNVATAKDIISLKDVEMGTMLFSNKVNEHLLFLKGMDGKFTIIVYKDEKLDELVSIEAGPTATFHYDPNNARLVYATTDNEGEAIYRLDLTTDVPVPEKIGEGSNIWQVTVAAE